MSFRFDDDNEFEEVDEEETDQESEDEDESDEDESDEDESDEDESDEDEPEDDQDDDEEDEEAAKLERIEQAFRTERTRIRACDDIAELRTMRRDYQEILAGAVGVGRLRMNDLIELVDEQVTNLNAKRFAAGSP